MNNPEHVALLLLSRIKADKARELVTAGSHSIEGIATFSGAAIIEEDCLARARSPINWKSVAAYFFNILEDSVSPADLKAILLDGSKTSEILDRVEEEIKQEMPLQIRKGAVRTNVNVSFDSLKVV